MVHDKYLLTACYNRSDTTYLFFISADIFFLEVHPDLPILYLCFELSKFCFPYSCLGLLLLSGCKGLACAGLALLGLFQCLVYFFLKMTCFALSPTQFIFLAVTAGMGH